MAASLLALCRTGGMERPLSLRYKEVAGGAWAGLQNLR